MGSGLNATLSLHMKVDLDDSAKTQITVSDNGFLYPMPTFLCFLQNLYMANTVRLRSGEDNVYSK